MAIRFMTNYDLEIGENKNSSVCHCCGKKSCVGHGFIYKDGDAYSVYYVAWSNAHLDKKVSLALAIGEWDDDSTNKDRTCFGVEVYEGDEEILFRVIEPSESPWANTDLLGPMLNRKDSLAHPLLKEVFTIVEYILRNHPALVEYLEIPKEQKSFVVKH